MTLLTAPSIAPSIPRDITAGDLLNMEDNVGYELVDGRLRERNVSKESSRVGLRIGRLLANEAERTGEAEVYGADLGYKCFPPNSEKEIRKPDASLIRKEHLTSITGDVGYMTIPADLTVEVLSTDDLAHEVSDKVEEYLEAGFNLVWVVDPVNRLVTIHRRDGSVTKLHEGDEITGESALPGFRCKVADLLK
jgi:Uma2 family endonuclease